MKNDSVVFVLFLFVAVSSFVGSIVISSNHERIKTLEKKLEEKGAPAEEPRKYREDCCSYYPD